MGEGVVVVVCGAGGAGAACARVARIANDADKISPRKEIETILGWMEEKDM